MHKLANILGVETDFLKRLDKTMATRTGRKGVLGRVAEENNTHVRDTLHALGVRGGADAGEVRSALLKAVRANEKSLLAYVATLPGANQFDQAAHLARQIARVGKGFFLKKEFGAKILRAHKPKNLFAFLGIPNVRDLLKKYDVTEVFSALRFIESDEWMHAAFEKGYSGFTAADFEEREIAVKVLGPEWREVAEKFIAKKHHNVSHLKEFGVIFINPITENLPGKFLRDFALLLHYFHEIEFYSKLFRRYAAGADFPNRLKALLRGDVKDASSVSEGEWLIVQRYLFKENHADPRLFLPRVNPESMHWLRGERDLARLGEENEALSELARWRDLDWVSLYDDAGGRAVSFDLEDNAMSAVSAAEGKKEFFGYHQREALWTKIFKEYAGGEAEMERLLLENFDKGSVVFNR